MKALEEKLLRAEQENHTLRDQSLCFEENVNNLKGIKPLANSYRSYPVTHERK